MLLYSLVLVSTNKQIYWQLEKMLYSYKAIINYSYCIITYRFWLSNSLNIEYLYVKMIYETTKINFLVNFTIFIQLLKPFLVIKCSISYKWSIFLSSLQIFSGLWKSPIKFELPSAFAWKIFYVRIFNLRFLEKIS